MPARVSPAVFAGLLALAGWVPAHAAKWRFVPRIGVQQTYSDNVELRPADQARGDFISQADLGFLASGTGRRLNFDVNYDLQALRYWRSNGADAINNQLQADARAELLPRSLFLDARSTVAQYNTTSTGRLDTSNLAITGNRSTVVTYSLTPTWLHHFGEFADSTLGYAYQWVNASGTTASARTQRAFAALRSGRRFQRLPWSLEASHTQSDGAAGLRARFDSAQANLHYRLTRTYGLTFSTGYQSNRTTSQEALVSAANESGVIWSAGGTWTPSRRTSLAAGFHHQLFGNGYFLNFTHRARRMVFTAGYNEQLTTTAQQLASQQLVPLTNAFGQAITNPFSGANIQVPLNTLSLTNAVVIDKTFNGSVAYHGLRNDANLNAYLQRRDSQGIFGSERVYGVNGSVSRRLSPRSTVQLRGNWQRTTGGLGQGRNTLWEAGLVFEHRLARDVNSSLDFRHLANDSTQPGFNYRENRVSVRVDVAF